MISSYNKTPLNYGDILKTITIMNKPSKIVEFGILNGFSLLAFAENVQNDTTIEAYDIFEDFNGNSAPKDIDDKFKDYKNVKIMYGDFYKKVNEFDNGSIDLLHIDIANDGDVYEFAINNYLDKLTKKGVMILEGGSDERDAVEWMKKHNKRSITEIIKKYSKRFDYDIRVLEKFPSMTLISKRNYILRDLHVDDYDCGFIELINYFTRDPEVISKEKFKEALDNVNRTDNYVKVIEYNNQIIGTVKLIIEQKFHNNCAKMGHIEDLVVSEKFRNLGVGKVLSNHAIKLSKEYGCYKIVLCSDDRNIEFYKKCGYKNKGNEMTIYL